MSRTKVTEFMEWKLEEEGKPERWMDANGNPRLRSEEGRDLVIELVDVVDFLHVKEITQISTVSNSNMVLISSKDGSVSMWRLRDSDSGAKADGGRVLQYVEILGLQQVDCQGLDKDPATDVTLGKEATIAVSSSHDGTVTLWDLERNTPIRKLASRIDRVSTVSMSDDGRVIATGSIFDYSLKIWNTEGKEMAHYMEDDCELLEQLGGLRRVRFLPNSNLHLFSCGGPTVKLWNVASGERSVKGQSKSDLFNLAISNDANLMAYGGQSQVCGILEARVSSESNITFKKCPGLRNAFGEVNSLSFSPNGELLAAACGQHIAIWKTNSRSRIGEIINHCKPFKVGPGQLVKLRCTAVAWSSDGKYLITGYNDGILNVFRITDDVIRLER